METYQQLNNNLKKLVSSLKSKQSRDETGLFIAEGEKLCEELLTSKYKTELIVIRSTSGDEIISLAKKFGKMNVPVYYARSRQFDQFCSSKSPQDIIAVVNSASASELSDMPIIAIDGISDPGNLGTIIRTADWFGFKNIVLGNDCADRYNSKTVRASMGSLFRCEIFVENDLAGFIKNIKPGCKIYGASLDGKITLNGIKPTAEYCIVFGNESHGISKPVQDLLTDKFIIPGYGKAESLNVAVAVGICLYHFKGT